MNMTQTLEKARLVCRMRRLSWHTENCYCDWLKRFIPHLKLHAHLSREERVRTWLEGLAPNVSASTQNQALSAVLFLYRDVLNQPLQEIGKWARAKRPQRLPTWLTAEEVHQLLNHMTGTSRLMAALAYGSGLRLAELLALRIKDVDVEAGVITVHGGKGDKDRTTCLPRRLGPAITQHLQTVRATWENDLAASLPPIFLPDGLERKYPKAGLDWPWFWLFPAGSLSTDPRSQIHRRHHLHEDTLGKALKSAASRAGISKRISAHTLRHSFATAMLMTGHSIHEVQELLGHSSIETTQVYLHCLPNLSGRITSPMDQLPTAPKVLAFPSPFSPAASVSR